MSTSYYKDIYNYLSKKYPYSKVYLISDHHFFHDNIIMYERVQFSNVNEMNSFIIKNHNQIVNNNDVVIFLGDFSFKNNAIETLLSNMNGHKYLLFGNHDKESIAKKHNGFEGVFTSPLKFENAYLSHYPLNSEDCNNIHYQLLLKEFENNPIGINYHGHIHTNRQFDNKYSNVTCEALDYKPALLGYTGCFCDEKKPLLINGDYFLSLVELISKEQSLNSTLLIEDYIYAMMLESINNYADKTCIYGSYPQYKKYGYNRNFSDLDVALIYNDNISKSKNIQQLKKIVDEIYESISKIDSVNLTFIKRIVNMCAFNYLYLNNGTKVKGALDTNLIPINFYRDCDFQKTKDKSIIEKFLYKNNSNLLNEYSLPSFEANFLTTDSDISNLILQLLFQKGYESKKEVVIKRLRYISKHYNKDISFDENIYEDILTRFFLRNIIFLSTLRRESEINYIKNINITKSNYLQLIPVSLRPLVEDLLVNPSSYFNDVFNELKQVPNNEICEISKKLIKVNYNMIK